MSRTKKHRDLFFLRFLHRLIKSIGSPFTHPRASRWAKVRRKVSRQYGGINQRVDTKYNWTPYKRAAKRSDRREALQQAHQQLTEHEKDTDYQRRVQIQRDWWESLDD